MALLNNDKDDNDGDDDDEEEEENEGYNEEQMSADTCWLMLAAWYGLSMHGNWWSTL